MDLLHDRAPSYEPASVNLARVPTDHNRDHGVRLLPLPYEPAFTVQRMERRQHDGAYAENHRRPVRSSSAN
jgi:hypothetical protein